MGEHISRERGPAPVLTTLFFTVTMGSLALVLDLGSYIHNHQQLRNGVDSAALAGAWHLPGDPTQAESDAITWAGHTNVLSSEITEAYAFTTATANGTIRVSASHPWDYTFGKVLGLSSRTLTTCAFPGRYDGTNQPASDVPQVYAPTLVH